MATTTTTTQQQRQPSFEILQSAVLETSYYLLDVETFAPEDDEKELGIILKEDMPDTIAILQNNINNNKIQKVIIGCGTDWVKCACGTVNIAIRLVVEEDSNNNDDDNDNDDDDDDKTKKTKKNKKQKPNNSSNTTVLSLFGGTDGDRSNAGDSVFWEKIKEKAPTITPEKWTEFCTNSNIPGLVVTDDGDDEEDEEDDWRPHAKCPDIIHSTIILMLAEKYLNNVVTKCEDSEWKYVGKSDEIVCDGNKVDGHVWSRRQQQLRSSL